jgi:aspartate oxidase
MVIYTVILLALFLLDQLQLRRLGGLFAQQWFKFAVFTWRCSSTPGSACVTSGWTTSSPWPAPGLQVATIVWLIGCAGSLRFSGELIVAAIKSAITTRRFDAVIVGAGGSGMRASLQLAEAGLNVAVLSKVFPTRSHTVAAQGGIGASLGNMSEDNWHWHMFDTVKGSTGWATRTPSNSCAAKHRRSSSWNTSACPSTATRRHHLPASVRRPHRQLRRKAGAARLRCRRPYRSRLLHTLYQRNVRAKTHFFVEWMALDLIRDAEGDVVGVTLEMETGEIMMLHAKTTLFATGGAGRIFAASTNAFINTGDGLGMAARAGMPLQDMEFWQFHPTGVAGAGVLITEGARRRRHPDQQQGERFMERYAPTLKDLAPRDFVSRSMDQEIKEGRGCGPNKDHVLLDLRHLGADTIKKRLPSILEIGHKFANVDATKEPIPVVPTIHYQMGGIPTNIHGQVVGPRVAMKKVVTACTPSANAPACRCTAPTAWAPTRCWTWWSSAAQPATTSSAAACRTRATSRCRPTPDRSLARLRAWKAAPAPNVCRTWPTTSAPPCRSTAACSVPTTC